MKTTTTDASIYSAAVLANAKRTASGANQVLETVAQCSIIDFTVTPEEFAARLRPEPVREQFEAVGFKASLKVRIEAARQLYERCAGLTLGEHSRLTENARQTLEALDVSNLVDLSSRSLTPIELERLKAEFAKHLGSPSEIRLIGSILASHLAQGASKSDAAVTATAMRLAVCQASADCAPDSTHALLMCITLGACGRSVESTMTAIAMREGVNEAKLLAMADEYASAIKRQDVDYLFRKR